VLIEVLIVHEFGGVGLGVEMAPMHLFGLSDYGLIYNSYRVLGVIWKYSWLTPLLVMICDCFLRKEAGEVGVANSSDFFISE
jgi:hypothetical protein